MNTYKGNLDDNEPMDIAIIVSRFNEELALLLLQGTTKVLDEKGVNYHIVWVPGAFEIPAMAKRMTFSGRFDAIICLGAVIRGETAHFDYVANEATRGIAEAGDIADVPVIFGVLTTENRQQAIERADPNKKDKGGYCANAAIEMVSLTRQLEEDHLLDPPSPEDFLINFASEKTPLFDE